MTDEQQKKIFSKNLNKLISKTGKTQKEIADSIGVNPQTLNTWCTGNALPRMGKVQKLADYFDVSKSTLLEDEGWKENVLEDTFDNIFPIKLKKFPVLGEIACGEPIFADENRESYIVAGVDIDADFCLQCRGDSMINAFIRDGDYVFVRKQSIVENGEIAAVVIGEEATLKRVFYYPDDNMIILKPENPKYEDKIFKGQELEEIHILGKAVAFQSDVR